jgi:hypothetical protein
MTGNRSRFETCPYRIKGQTPRKNRDFATLNKGLPLQKRILDSNSKKVNLSFGMILV